MKYARINFIVGCFILIIAIGFGVRHITDRGTLQPSVQQPTAIQNQKPTFDKQQFALDQPASPWLIVNKQRPLEPSTYTPQTAAPNVPLRLAGTNPEMQVSVAITEAVEQMFAAAKNDGLDLMLASGYRSYQQQAAVYANEVKRYGQAQADRESARPGYSEHQTGLALDVEPVGRLCEIAACFADTPEGQWVAANAHSYGFIIRYPRDKEAVTGYTYEPWHLRYVGVELAAEINRLGNPPLETFFNLGPAPAY